MNIPERVLLSNDDGLFSNGMKHLESELGKHLEVWAVAPDRERSATSQALTIRETLRLHRVKERHFTVSGFPVDCVNVALHEESFPEFDLVVSGINHGVNMGDDVFYSGTVGAARHAAIHGIKAIAISSGILSPRGDFQRTARWLSTWILENYNRMKTGIVYNINYPEENAPLESPFPPVVFTAQGKRIYLDGYIKLEDSKEYTVLKLKDADLGNLERDGTDFDVYDRGYISITPLGLDTTHKEELQRWITK